MNRYRVTYTCVEPDRVIRVTAYAYRPSQAIAMAWPTKLKVIGAKARKVKV